MADLLSHTGRPVPAGAPARQIAKAQRRARKLAGMLVKCRELPSGTFRPDAPSEVRDWFLAELNHARAMERLFSMVQVLIYGDRLPEIFTHYRRNERFGIPLFQKKPGT